jgi:acetyl esterase/lipase
MRCFWFGLFIFLELLLGSLSAASPVYFFPEPTEKNVIYGMDHGAALLLDVYRPKKANGYGLIFVMGTGFTAAGEYNDVPLKELDRSLVENKIFPPLFGGTGHLYDPCLEAGFTVFSINHRLAPAHTWKTQVRDCQRAVQFIRYHAKRYGIQSAAIGGMGHSSGASMTAFLAVMDEVADVNSFDPVERESSRIQAAVPFAGVHDLLGFRDQRPGGATIVAGFVGRAILWQPPKHPVYAAYREASTIHYITKDDAPMLIYHGDADDVVDVQQSKTLAEALTKAGVQNELVILPGADHGQLAKPMQPTPGERAAVWLKEQLGKNRK